MISGIPLKMSDYKTSAVFTRELYKMAQVQYILGWPINALTRTGTRPETRPEGGGAGRGRHSMVQVFSGRVYCHIEIRVFFKSIPEKADETRTF